MTESRLSLNVASLEQIHRHLALCDESFVPNLSGRVDISEYARKIHDHADRFESWEKGELAGLLAAYLKESTGFITSLSVLPSHRGTGISGQLLEKCRSMAEKSKIHRLELEVDSRNMIAVGLYRKYGFKEIQNTDSTVLMRLIIGC